MNKRSLLATPYIVWIIGFTVLPLLLIIGYALMDVNGGFTLSNILAIFDPIHGKAFLLSLGIALLSTVICFVLAYPLALALRNLNFSKQGFIILVVVLPMWMNFILRILAWQMILSQNGILNMVLSWMHLPRQNMINTPVAIMIGMVYDYLPFMILPIYNALMDIDEDIIEAARDLGANQAVVVRRIIFPLTVRGIASGVTMVFVPSLTTFVISNILGGGKVQLIGNIIEQEFTKSMNWNLGSGLSVALMIFVLISMLFTMKNESNDKGTIVW